MIGGEGPGAAVTQQLSQIGNLKVTYQLFLCRLSCLQPNWGKYFWGKNKDTRRGGIIRTVDQKTRKKKTHTNKSYMFCMQAAFNIQPGPESQYETPWCLDVKKRAILWGGSCEEGWSFFCQPNLESFMKDKNQIHLFFFYNHETLLWLRQYKWCSALEAEVCRVLFNSSHKAAAITAWTLAWQLPNNDLLRNHNLWDSTTSFWPNASSREENCFLKKTKDNSWSTMSLL